LAATPGGERPTHRLLALADAEWLAGDPGRMRAVAAEVIEHTASGAELLWAHSMLDTFIDDHLIGAAEFARLADRPELDQDQRRQARINQASRLHKAGRLEDARSLLRSLLPPERNVTWSQLIGNIAFLDRMSGHPVDEQELRDALDIERKWNAENG